MRVGVLGVLSEAGEVGDAVVVINADLVFLIKVMSVKEWNLTNGWLVGWMVESMNDGEVMGK